MNEIFLVQTSIIPLSLSFSLSLLDAGPNDKEQLLINKIQQCCYLFDFTDPMADLRAKEIKRAALNEILDYITNYRGVLSEPVYPEIVKLVNSSPIYNS